MDYRDFGGTYYVRLDRGDEVVGSLELLCAREGIRSATFSGIGGCSSAAISTFVPEAGAFQTEIFEGMLELLSVMGNIMADDAGEYHHHAHASFSYKKDGTTCVVGGT